MELDADDRADCAGKAVLLRTDHWQHVATPQYAVASPYISEATTAAQRLLRATHPGLRNVRWSAPCAGHCLITDCRGSQRLCQLVVPGRATCHTQRASGVCSLTHTLLEQEKIMARLPLTHPPSVVLTLTTFLSNKILGKVPDIALVGLHHRGYATATIAHEALASRWRTLSPTDQALAVLTAAMEVGCSWCIDFGYWRFHHEGVPARKLRDIDAARSSDVYSPAERLVIAYASAMSRTPVEVTDEMVAQLRAHFTDTQLVELTALVALENQRSRMNAALGLTSQGFSSVCAVPRAPSEEQVS
ncbi:MAG: carboxymuconolactone decarboxylase family protein [Ornithinimicrobium sp.]